LAEIGRGLKAALEKTDQAKVALSTAANLAEEAAAALASAGTGTAQADVEQAYSQFAEVVDGTVGADGLVSMLDAAVEIVRRILASLGIDGTGLSVEPLPGGKTNSAPPQVSRERVEALRKELPPPVQPRTGQKTHGRVVVGNGASDAIISGDDSDAEAARNALLEEGYPLPGQPIVATHVEMKVAARMRVQGVTHATMVINHVPCLLDLGCDNLIGVVLPAGSSLTVHGTGGYQQTFTGGKRPPWRR
jgi:hypothetical protein